MLHLSVETLLMKKIHLSIAKPCHENWESMTPIEKGKLCSSCQKAVIDFTNMSDGQIAEFFKKPPSSVCGRVYIDQLDRDIEIPKKRIPWTRYFFQFTWPAFVLFLKSCGVKQDAKNKMSFELKASQSKEETVATLGIMMPEITPVDTTNLVEEKIVRQGNIMGDIEIDSGTIRKMDSAATEVDTSVANADTIFKPMDTVTVIAYQTTVERIVTGSISSVCVTENNQTKSDTVKKETLFHGLNFKAYPNPVRAGSLLTISFESTDDFPEQIQILSSSGQLISFRKQNEKEHSFLASIPIPSSLTAGVYFLQIITKNREVKTTKIIVTI